MDLHRCNVFSFWVLETLGRNFKTIQKVQYICVSMLSILCSSALTSKPQKPKITKESRKKNARKQKTTLKTQEEKNTETYGVLTRSPNLCFLLFFFLFSGIGRGEVHPQNWDPNGLEGNEMDTKCHIRVFHICPKTQRSALFSDIYIYIYI